MVNRMDKRVHDHCFADIVYVSHLSMCRVFTALSGLRQVLPLLHAVLLWWALMLWAVHYKPCALHVSLGPPSSHFVPHFGYRGQLP